MAMGSAGRGGRRMRAQARRDAVMGYVFIAPYVVTAGVFTFGLLAYAFAMSFTDLSASYSTTTGRFVGLRNYVRALGDADFLVALVNAFWFFAIVTTVQTIGAIGLAVLLNARLRGLRVFRTLLYSPSVASSVVISLIFLWLYLRTGFLNYVLGTDVAWLSDARRLFDPVLGWLGVEGVPLLLRGPSVTWMAVMGLNVFTTVPTFMVMFLAALQDIPGHLYEAGALDGATGWRALWHITLPLLRPVIALVVVLGTIGTFQVFDQVRILTAGGPAKTTLTPVYLVYVKTLGQGTRAEAGFGAAMAFILAFVIVVITLVQRRFIERAMDQ